MLARQLSKDQLMRKVWKNYLFYDISWKQYFNYCCLSFHLFSIFFACLKLSPQGGLFRNPKAFFMKITKGDKLIRLGGASVPLKLKCQ